MVIYWINQEIYHSYKCGISVISTKLKIEVLVINSHLYSIYVFNIIWRCSD